MKIKVDHWMHVYKIQDYSFKLSNISVLTLNIVFVSEDPPFSSDLWKNLAIIVFLTVVKLIVFTTVTDCSTEITLLQLLCLLHRPVVC